MYMKFVFFNELYIYITYFLYIILQCFVFQFLIFLVILYCQIKKARKDIYKCNLDLHKHITVKRYKKWIIIRLLFVSLKHGHMSTLDLFL